MFKPLQGRTAIVTGASKGIGRGIACRLGEAGVNVMVVSRTIGDGARARSRSYSSRMRRQFVSAYVGAVACSEAIAASQWNGVIRSPPIESLITGAGRGGALWITGRASQRTTAQLSALNWSLVPKVGDRLGK